MALTVEVPGGTHTIVLRKSGYFPLKFNITVEVGKTYTISKTLTPTNAIQIFDVTFNPTSPVEGDTVTVGFTLKNTDPNQTHNVKYTIYLDGAVKQSAVLAKPLDPNSSTNVSYNLGTLSAGTYTVKIEAQVMVEEHESGTGWYTTHTATKSLTVSPPPPTTATVTISTTPSGAAVYIDGEYKGTT